MLVIWGRVETISPFQSTTNQSLEKRGKLNSKSNFKFVVIGFGGLGVACWTLVPMFAGSKPAEAFGYLGRKNPKHVFLRRGSKAVGPMS